MTLAKNMTVGEIAAQHPAALKVFARHRIDVISGGKDPIEEVCRTTGLDLDGLLDEVRMADHLEIPTDVRDWNAAPLKDVIRHITDRHHAYLDAALPALDRMITRAADVHGKQYPEVLGPLKEVFRKLKDELTQHLRKEEMILFPAVAALEEEAARGGSARRSPYGQVGQPIGILEHDHDDADRALALIRKMTHDFELPAGAGNVMRTLYQELKVFEADMQRHLHLENNILFARANRLQASLTK